MNGNLLRGKRRIIPFPWGNEDTQQLIDILGKYNIKATFFVVGQWVDKYPESVKALSDAGHEVMNHSNTHAHMSKLSRDEIIADVNACNDKIEAVTGVRPTLIRPPYGEYDDNVVSSIRSMGMEPIQWDVERSVPHSSHCDTTNWSLAQWVFDRVRNETAEFSCLSRMQESASQKYKTPFQLRGFVA